MYYDWQKTFTYDADVTMVIGARDVGKTFGLREQFLRDYMRDGSRFVALSRTKARIPKLSAGFFDGVIAKTEDNKLQEWINEERPVFRTSLSRMQVGHTLNNGKASDFKDIGYFVALSRKQDAKEETFVNVRRLVLDEAIIEPDERQYSRYQRDEWGKLASIVDSCSRERPDQTAHKPNVYLLANACDLVNPWFQELGINTIPEYGRHWYRNKTFLLDYVDPSAYEGDYADAKLDGTVSGRMLRGRSGAKSYAQNAFEVRLDLVADRSANARYEEGFIYRGQIFGVWVDVKQALTFITPTFAQGIYRPMYALTSEDNRINYLTAKKAEKALRDLVQLYSVGAIRFTTPAIQESFLRMLRDFGVR